MTPAARAQRFDGFEQGHGHQPGIVGDPANLHAACFREANNREHVVLGLRAADDVVLNGLCRIGVFQFGDRAKCFQQFASSVLIPLRR